MPIILIETGSFMSIKIKDSCPYNAGHHNIKANIDIIVAQNKLSRFKEDLVRYLYRNNGITKGEFIKIYTKSEVCWEGTTKKTVSIGFDELVKQGVIFKSSNRKYYVL